MLGRWKSLIKQQSDPDERSSHPAHFSHVDFQNKSCSRKGRQLVWVWLLRWLPGLKHYTHAPAVLGRSVAELGAPGEEPAASTGGALSYSGGAPCSCITMTSATQVGQIWVQFQIKKCQSTGSLGGR